MFCERESKGDGSRCSVAYGKRPQPTAHDVLVSLESFNDFYNGIPGRLIDDTMPEVMKTRRLQWGNEKSLQGQGLFVLLELHGRQQCQMRRDRIFALLGLCSDGDRVSVNYSTSDVELVWDIMRSYSELLCLCTLSILAETLGLWDLLKLDPKNWAYMETFETIRSIGAHHGIPDSQTFSISVLQIRTSRAQRIYIYYGLQPSHSMWECMIVSSDIPSTKDAVKIRIDLDLPKFCSQYSDSFANTLAIELSSSCIQIDLFRNKVWYIDSSEEPWKWLEDSIILELDNKSSARCHLSLGFWLFVTGHRPVTRCCSREYEHEAPDIWESGSRVAWQKRRTETGRNCSRCHQTSMISFALFTIREMRWPTI